MYDVWRSVMAADASDSSSESQPVFSDEEFWYKIDIDWDEVQEKFEKQQGETKEEEDDSEDSPETFSEALLAEFAKERRRVLLRYRGWLRPQGRLRIAVPVLEILGPY
jgi:hypothetical protein